jgi:tRNA(Ile)-lysidine synthase TilS/MesJ
LCGRCKKKNAIIYRIHSGEKVCKGCFLKEIEDKTRRSMKNNDMIDLEDKIALAVSGGKDSVAMVDIIYKIHHNLINQQIIRGRPPVAITIDEGIETYRKESLSIAKKICKDHSLNHKIFSFEEEFGLSLDKMVQLGKNSYFKNELQKK